MCSAHKRSPRASGIYWLELPGEKTRIQLKKQTLWCDMHSSSVCPNKSQKGGYFVASESYCLDTERT